MDPADNADSSNVLTDAEEDVTNREVLLVSVGVAVASVHDGAGTWLTEVHHELGHVPRLVALSDLCSAWLGLVEILLSVDFLVTHIKIIKSDTPSLN